MDCFITDDITLFEKSRFTAGFNVLGDCMDASLFLIHIDTSFVPLRKA